MKILQLHAISVVIIIEQYVLYDLLFLFSPSFFF